MNVYGNIECVCVIICCVRFGEIVIIGKLICNMYVLILDD